ncbi:heme-binding protein [Saccharopolyspora indica]|uniref:GlcG/HbpS family heme-binding protein n=1 Tax=Saccharopolyspora indica TaxID=1229659 RepID=UPI0022EB5295|nr:heme-binding protein [Saccharopolyspora indica]MDA3646314.1 heme-binding protein [Saccharopolyspora indica]
MRSALAQQILTAVQDAATEGGFAVCATVVDEAAHPVAFVRMDGAQRGPAEVSLRKARTAALFGTDSAELGQEARPGGAIYTLEHTNGGLISFGGGVVVRDADGNTIGAVGVAGATVAADEELAQTGARTAAAILA